LKIKCVHDNSVDELTRAIRGSMTSLIDGLEESDLNAMTLGLAHSLSRYKLKFSPDKVDTMIVQAIGLLDDLDKELNNYVMRVREWYGLHFPELGKIVTDNMMYVRLVKKVGFSQNIASSNLEEILPEELIEEVRDASIVTMGSSISDSDLSHIRHLCEQVESLSNYRETLFNYIKNRMNAIAPNLSVLVGELVGARLIAHAGSLMNLAKHPASTVQILGAEKALFRALKTKHDTPKYGLLYHASLVGQASNKHKGKVSRMLANKASLSIRVDALGEEEGPSIGVEDRAKLEAKLRMLEEGQMHRLSGTSKTDKKFKKFDPSQSQTKIYNASSDFSIKTENGEDDKKKVKVKEEKDDKESVRKIKEEETDSSIKEIKEKKEKKVKKEKKEKKVKKEKKEEEPQDPDTDRKKKRKRESEEASPATEDSKPKKKKKN